MVGENSSGREHRSRQDARLDARAQEVQIDPAVRRNPNLGSVGEAASPVPIEDAVSRTRSPWWAPARKK